jgi:benzylsuccinate CoA-transferase BbsF subunit
MAQVMNGVQPERMGNRDPHIAPHGIFHCKGEDRWVSIVVANDDEWRQLCAGMGRPDLAADPQFATLTARKQNEDTLEKLITAWTEALSAEEVTAKLQAVGVAAYPTLTNQELAEDQHLQYREFFVELPHPEVGARRHAGLPWHFSNTPCQVQRSAPCLGQDTDDVMERVLGYSLEDIEKLKKKNVLI